MIVGIDFGTCYSNVAVMVGDVPITDHIRNTTKYGIPTEFLFHDDVEYYGVNCHSRDLVQYRGDIITRMKKLIREDQNNINKFKK
ncbi:hypothetical protein [uncultured Methanobrevibacter sp.]|uniref:hypothetical protein n=1 Tax=uncultured Methanobrevibacter sp. TaxID=253161 RepID=UPI00261B7C7F|nr:hypothetical protein [uncultured Methanobrevibacter sp.]